jgi:putative ABC transport system ATP-binding protein
MMRRFGLEDIPADRSFERLSVGEQQRLCFVRTLTMQPLVLLLDEPTSALDQQNAQMLERLVDEWLDEDDERAAIWVTHDEAQAQRVATRHVRLEGGRFR